MQYKPSAPEDLDELHKCGAKTLPLPGVFVGYHQLAGGQWSGDLLVADQEEIEEIESVERSSEVLFVHGMVTGNEVGISIQTAEEEEDVAFSSVESVENSENMSRESLEVPALTIFSY